MNARYSNNNHNSERVFYYTMREEMPSALRWLVRLKQIWVQKEAKHGWYIIATRGDIHMKTLIYVLSGALILIGAVWVLQGINILPGSFMTGQIQWAYNGAVAIVIGIGLIIFGRRRK